MNINHHIRIFLYQNGSLILPSLGMFKTEYQPAKPDPRKKMFHPPRKTVEFFEDTTTNDTSFENYLAKAENINLIQASKELHNYIEELRSALKKGKKVYLNHIGVLSMGKDQQILFVPDQKQNFIPEAANSKVLNLRQVKRSKSDIRRNISQNIPAEKADRARKTSVLWPILLLIFLFIIIYLIINPLNYNFVQKHYSGVIPLVEINKLNLEEVESIAETPVDKNREKSISGKNQGEKESKKQTTETETKAKAKEQPAPLKKEENKSIKPKEKTIDPKMPAETLPEGIQYYIIVASYDGPAISEKYRDKLKKQGFEAHVIGPSKNGKYRVSIGHFADKQRAVSFMNNIRRTHTSSAWILKK